MNITAEGLEGKNVLVVGLARSGTGAANLLSSYGADVTVTDKRPRSLLQKNIDRLRPPVRTITGENPEEAFIGSDLIVVSPGVPLDIPPIASARNKGVPVIGELELAYRTVKSYGLKVKSEKQGAETVKAPAFIGVTGTNGKSTVVTLIDLMLRESGYKTILGGNIGNALTEELLKLADEGSNLMGIDLIVAEISSFQLESIDSFRPSVAVILNITSDHLDRYNTLNDYAYAKARIFENQGEGDYLLLNADDPEVKIVESEKLNVKSGKPKSLFFSSKKEVQGLYLKDGSIFCDLPDTLPAGCHSMLIDVDDIRIKGAHNIENAMAAALAALISGCSLDAVRKVLGSFPGLEHRNEHVRTFNGITFINDSKGTNAGAVAKSLEDCNDVILIMGGRDKGSDFSPLKEIVKDKVRLLVLIGEAKDKIAEDIGAVTDIEYAADMNGAVALSSARASGGDIVLLSPGCASFDMFESFEERGRIFKQAVNAL